MDLENAGRFLPKTINLMLFFTLTSEYEFLMSAQEVATKMRKS